MHLKLKLSIFFNLLFLFIFEMKLDRKIKNKKILDKKLKTKNDK